MHNNTELVLARIRRLLAQRIEPAIYRSKSPVNMKAWQAPDEPVPFVEVLNQNYRPFHNGDRWGRPWGTTWIHVEGSVPASWKNIPRTTIELIADIGFDQTQTGFQCEAMAYTPVGTIIKAIEPHNRYVSLPQDINAVDLYLEAASNPDVINEWTFVPTQLGRWGSAGEEPQYQLVEVALGLRDNTMADLAEDLRVLLGLVDTLDPSSSRRALIVGAFTQCLQILDPDDLVGTVQEARGSLAGVLASPAVPSAHTIIGVGHAHIDSAWLWPIRETARKAARTFSNALDLMDRNPDFVFAASSAQQYAWVKCFYPELFERIRSRVADGRFVPVGGMWVESDTNMPGSEALVRQFVYGGAFFKEEFGIDQPEAWLPDSFGYSASMPQIMRLAGINAFLTQKISWNHVNRMPHHTFLWEGIDGSRIFTHFPPVDTYACELTAVELKRAEDQYAEKAMGTLSLAPYGYGDGGGGPTREMLSIAARKRDLEGSPRVELASPTEFFDKAKAEYPNPPVWSGELYLELHRGTYTSQAKTKRGNRESESLLHQAELWAASATIHKSVEYPYEELEEIWEQVLLYQFHDILPGTCIGWVHDEVEAQYEVIRAKLRALIGRSLAALDGERLGVANATSFALNGVPAMGMGVPVKQKGSVSATKQSDGSVFVQTEALTAVIDRDGMLASLIDMAANRDAFAPGCPGNQLQLFRDTPSEWDAWDIDIVDRSTKMTLNSVESITVAKSDERITVTVSRNFGASHVSQDLVFEANAPSVTIRTTVEWHEREKMLKLAFPFDVRAEQATSEIQFGHLHRSIHTNTSWDVARFETSAHKWVHVGEPDYGFALANDAMYGHDFDRWTQDDGTTITQVRQSLLRAPLYPDPETDQGSQVFTTVLRVGAGIREAIVEGYALNTPLLEGYFPLDFLPLFTIDDSSVVVEAVKLAEDRSGDVIVRFYESLGNRAEVMVGSNFPWEQVWEVDLHERRFGTGALVSTSEEGVGLRLRPFQIVTLRYARLL